MLHLASRSPRRSELLARLGLAFGVLDLDVPEVRAEGEPPEDYVRRVAREKAGAGLLQLAGQREAWVLAADTEVVLDDLVFGKPIDAADAARMLRMLAGRAHVVISAVSLVSAARELQVVSKSVVTFGELSPAVLDWYIASGEWQGKAGAYGIQGAAQVFIIHLDGSHSGVMGLPLAETSSLLAQAGMWP
ncbi:Maf family protein [Solilutibacter silvestris]|uniref:dTTP/UTP pyrophosphatase n=1 Tax=Solilutibacter silvestris TaxID=1645665 RepID=A0A2K1Q3A6_9GAMM|nr:Maf family protein [Lysobacter silvestris]PNS09525.1 maf: septum formation protein Maf [Lysobacter silvestris]